MTIILKSIFVKLFLNNVKQKRFLQNRLCLRENLNFFENLKASFRVLSCSQYTTLSLSLARASTLLSLSSFA